MVDAPDRKRAAFLWRMTTKAGQFMLLGPQPHLESPWFTVETKPFDVQLREGQRLQFDLRVNATVNRMVDRARGRGGRKRSDVVMDAIHAAERDGGPARERAVLRSNLASGAVADWLSRQLRDNGAELLTAGGNGADFTLEGYAERKSVLARAAPALRERGGILRVRDPQAFRRKLETGFGRAKAFGCGLMLLKPG